MVKTSQPWATEDVEMRDVSRRPPPPAPRDIAQTLPRDPPLHVSNKENLEKARGPIRQSEISSQINTKDVVSEILNTDMAEVATSRTAKNLVQYINHYFKYFDNLNFK